MKKIVVVALMAMIIATIFSVSVMASVQSGPAPDSGDGIPDGSGMDNRPQSGNPDIETPGPAPDSGDGIPDGPCF